MSAAASCMGICGGSTATKLARTFDNGLPLASKLLNLPAAGDLPRVSAAAVSVSVVALFSKMLRRLRTAEWERSEDDMAARGEKDPSISACHFYEVTAVQSRIGQVGAEHTAPPFLTAATFLLTELHPPLLHVRDSWVCAESVALVPQVRPKQWLRGVPDLRDDWCSCSSPLALCVDPRVYAGQVCKEIQTHKCFKLDSSCCVDRQTTPLMHSTKMASSFEQGCKASVSVSAEEDAL